MTRMSELKLSLIMSNRLDSSMMDKHVNFFVQHQNYFNMVRNQNMHGQNFKYPSASQ